MHVAYRSVTALPGETIQAGPALRPDNIAGMVNDLTYSNNDHDAKITELYKRLNAVDEMLAFIAENSPEAIKQWQDFRGVRDRMMDSAKTVTVPTNHPSGASVQGGGLGAEWAK